ncbi:MAG: Hsp20/alpha crystallin family protein [Candidatus Buchananbacteria bacterium]
MGNIISGNKIHQYLAKEKPAEDSSGFFGVSDSKSKGWFSGEAQLSCDVFENENNIIVKSTVAGVKPENLEIAISNDLLTIRGFREDEDQVADDNYYCRECYWGAFSRSIVLPREVDQKKIDASLKNGVLTIKLTKKYKTSSIKVRQLSD